MRIIKPLFTFITIAILSLRSVHAQDPSPEMMFKRLAALASTGNADVKYNLGMFLNNGIGTPRDNRTAFQYFSEAADAGNALASYKVGCYLTGQFPGVVPINEAEALKFKLRAAEAGYDLAQYDVGMHFGKKGDLANAVIWWERSSRQANVQATAYLANYYSSKSSPDKIKGFALMLVLKDLMPNVTKELLDHIEKLDSQLSTAEKSEANTIRLSWVTGPTPLTTKARTGIKMIPALLTSLEH